MKEALKALDRLCNMASGQAGQDFSCAKVDYWTVKDAINNKWQPIETAPRDGTKILALNKNGDGYNRWGEACNNNEVCVVCWRNRPFNDYSWYLPHCCDGVSYIEPTHWMPLPAPPGEDE